MIAQNQCDGYHISRSLLRRTLLRQISAQHKWFSEPCLVCCSTVHIRRITYVGRTSDNENRLPNVVPLKLILTRFHCSHIPSPTFALHFVAVRRHFPRIGSSGLGTRLAPLYHIITDEALTYQPILGRFFFPHQPNSSAPHPSKQQERPPKTKETR